MNFIAERSISELCLIKDGLGAGVLTFEEPKTKGREAKTDDDGNEISGWANNNGAQNIIEVQDRLLHLKSSLNRKLERK